MYECMNVYNEENLIKSGFPKKRKGREGKCGDITGWGVGREGGDRQLSAMLSQSV